MEVHKATINLQLDRDLGREARIRMRVSLTSNCRCIEGSRQGANELDLSTLDRLKRSGPALWISVFRVHRWGSVEVADL